MNQTPIDMDEALLCIQRYFDDLFPGVFDIRGSMTEPSTSIIDTSTIGIMSMMIKKLEVQCLTLHFPEQNKYIVRASFSYYHPSGSNGYSLYFSFDKDGNLLQQW